MRLRPERRPLGLPGPRAPGSRLLGDSVRRCRPCARQPRPPTPVSQSRRPPFSSRHCLLLPFTPLRPPPPPGRSLHEAVLWAERLSPGPVTEACPGSRPGGDADGWEPHCPRTGLTHSNARRSPAGRAPSQSPGRRCMLGRAPHPGGPCPGVSYSVRGAPSRLGAGDKNTGPRGWGVTPFLSEASVCLGLPAGRPSHWGDGHVRVGRKQ